MPLAYYRLPFCVDLIHQGRKDSGLMRHGR